MFKCIFLEYRMCAFLCDLSVLTISVILKHLDLLYIKKKCNFALYNMGPLRQHGYELLKVLRITMKLSQL